MHIVSAKHHRLSILLVCICLILMTISHGEPIVNMPELSLSQQLITQTSFSLIVIITILAIAYFSFKTITYRAVILVCIAAFTAISASIIIEKLDFDSFLNQQKNRTIEKVSNIRSRLQNQIQADLQISKAIVIFMKSKNFQYTSDEFNAVAQNIVNSAPRISHFAVAPDLIINRIYPSKGNTKAIGLNYRENKQQWPPINRAISSGKTLLAGPVELVQGGIAFIGRIPVFTDPNSESLWGLVSVVIDMQKLFTAAGLNDDKDLHLALRGTNALGASGSVFLGDEILFSQNPIIQNIQLPKGNWQIAAIPATGWPDSSPAKITIRIAVFSFFLLAAFFIIFRASQHLKQARINEELLKEINERKSLEIEQQKLTKNLYHSQKMEAIGSLTGGIAHDFNNILAAISGYSQLSKILLEKQTEPEKLALHLDEIIKASDRAQKLVQQMLTFSRGKNVESQLVSPHAITKETLIMLESTIPATISIESVYSDLDCKILSDPIQFQQVILNLIVNSRDAIKDQIGMIMVSVKKISVDYDECSSCHQSVAGQYLQIKISDDGSGVSENHIARIFEPFYSTKEVGKGTGMGLSVVHGIVHAADGHIILDTNTLEGTTIRLLFPTVTTVEGIDEASANTSEKIQLKKGDGHILIIDDEQSITNLYNDFLFEMEMQSTLFNEPQKAIEFYQEHHAEITLVVTDQTMPKMTGTELAEKIRQIDPNVPIILCSGNTEVISENKKMNSGINVFLQKPVNLKVLSDEIYRFHH